MKWVELIGVREDSHVLDNLRLSGLPLAMARLYVKVWVGEE